MTQVAEPRESALPPEPTRMPLANAVPGAWMAPPWEGPAVYVPHERVEERFKDGEGRERTRVRYEQNTHIKRLVSEGWMPASGPTTGQASVNQVDEVARLKEINEQIMAELAELRAKLSTDPNTPNAPKRR